MATGWLVCVCMLTAWSVVPMAWGWRPSVVVSGSMEPHIRPGDVVLVDHSTRYVKRGTVVLADDAQVPSGHVLHRVVGTDPAGRLITKGDNNLTADSTHRTAADVEGMARLVVPRVGEVALLRSGRARASAWAWPGLTALCGIWLARPRGRFEDAPARQGRGAHAR